MGRRYDSKISYRLKEIPVKQITVWKEAQARKLDRMGITELARSIKIDGLQNPPMVQKSGKNQYLLMSGQRRLAALKRLGAKKIPALLLTNASRYDLEEAKAASVVENLHRNKMNEKDMTVACVFLAESIGKVKAARSLGISYMTLNKYLGFAAVPDKLRKFVPKELTRDDVVRLYQAVPNTAKSVKIAQKLIRLDPRLRKKYLVALAKSPRASHARLLKTARAKMLQKKIKFELSKSTAAKLRRHSNKNEIDPDDMAKKILHAWLKKR